MKYIETLAVARTTLVVVFFVLAVHSMATVAGIALPILLIAVFLGVEYLGRREAARLEAEALEAFRDKIAGMLRTMHDREGGPL